MDPARAVASTRSPRTFTAVAPASSIMISVRLGRLRPSGNHNYGAATMNDAEQGQNASGSWQPDPTGRYKLRWCNEAGTLTDHVYSSEGEMGNDPYDALPPPPSQS